MRLFYTRQPSRPECESHIQSTQKLGRSPRRDLCSRHGACVRVRLRILSTSSTVASLCSNTVPPEGFNSVIHMRGQKPRRTRRHTLQLRTHFSRENRKTHPWERDKSVIHAVVVGQGTMREDTLSRNQASHTRWTFTSEYREQRTSKRRASCSSIDQNACLKRQDNTGIMQ